MSYAELLQEQLRLKAMVRSRPLPAGVRFIGGADVSASLRSRDGYGGVVVLDALRGMEIVDRAVALGELEVPYIPGMLGFREVPLLVKAFSMLAKKPEVVVVDAQGAAHPRRFGAACHLGVVLGVPTVGCAKSLLCGTFSEPGIRRGSSSPLVLDGETVGRVLRTRDGVKPLFVSPGHLVTLEDCVEVVLGTTGRYRLPEPVRVAHAAVNEARLGSSSSPVRPPWP